ncbi:MAG: hypothetical protein R2824_12615 [Saprospiraceae bacterium]
MHLRLLLFITLFTVFTACQKEPLLPEQTATDQKQLIATIEKQIAAARQGMLEKQTFVLKHLPADAVELPAGSTDGLTAAIAEAGPGGTVLVKAGEHFESGTVLIGVAAPGWPGRYWRFMASSISMATAPAFSTTRSPIRYSVSGPAMKAAWLPVIRPTAILSGLSYAKCRLRSRSQTAVSSARKIQPPTGLHTTIRLMATSTWASSSSMGPTIIYWS